MTNQRYLVAPWRGRAPAVRRRTPVVAPGVSIVSVAVRRGTKRASGGRPATGRRGVAVRRGGRGRVVRVGVGVDWGGCGLSVLWKTMSSLSLTTSTLPLTMMVQQEKVFCFVWLEKCFLSQQGSGPLWSHCAKNGPALFTIGNILSETHSIGRRHFLQNSGQHFLTSSEAEAKQKRKSGKTHFKRRLNLNSQLHS